MPRKPSIKGLFEICLDFIKNNMEIWSLRRAAVDAPNSEASTNPFELLPPVTLGKIIRHLTVTNQLEARYLEFLITPSLRTLDFSMCTTNTICGLLRLASRKCPHLSSLSLERHGYFLDCLNLIPTFTHLQKLNVSWSPYPDSLLNLLGKYCENLKELYVNDSVVSDAGIRALCVTGTAKSLRILSILNYLDPYVPVERQNTSRVTLNGIVMALNNLPLLKKLRHDAVIDALSHVHKLTIRGELPADTKYALKELTVQSVSSYRKGYLPKAVILCPLLTKVDVTSPDELSDEDLLSLLSTGKLSDLVISRTRSGQISFDGGVAQLLKKTSIGNSLKSLVPCNLHDVSICMITKYCPNLTFLVIENFRDEEETAPEQLKQLSTLKFNRFFSYNNFVLLLSSPSLVSLSIDHCFSLDDDILKKAIDQNAFQNLESFELVSNDRVTQRGIDLLLIEETPLKVIKLDDCRNITKKNIQDWEKKIFDENWELSVSFKPHY